MIRLADLSPARGDPKRRNGRNEVDFITRSFKKRVCKTFIAASASAGEICGCGRERNLHQNFSSMVETWSKDDHTTTSKTDAFGEIKFLGFGRELDYQLKPYIRFADETHYHLDLWILLKKYWKVEPPTLLISVTGGNKNFHLSQKMGHAFRHGLVNAAASTGAWITSTGHNAGVAKVVGEAVGNYNIANLANKQITCLSFLSWGYVDNKEALVNKKGKGSYPAVYNSENCKATDLNKQAPLQPNHTHFLFIDDGVDKKYGGAEFRAGMEMYISQEVSRGGDMCPVVRLVLEGGVNTLDGAAEAIKNDIPCVFFKGTGRAADFVTHAYRITAQHSSDEKTIFPANFNELIEDETRQFLKQCKSDRSEQRIYESVRNILKKRLLVNVFDFSSGDSTDVEFSILNALLKAYRSDVHTQTSLALAWNRCDLAREEIFAPEKRLSWVAVPLQDYMTHALVQNQVGFVQLFLDKGVDIKKFLTDTKLAEIWTKSLDTNSSRAVDLIRATIRIVVSRDNHPGAAYTEVQLGPFLREIGEMLDKKLGFHCLNRYEERSKNVFENRNSRIGHRQFIDPEKELFFWAVLLNRPEMASLFWQTGNDQIALALAGSSILRALSKDASVHDMNDLSADLVEHARNLEEKAIGVLNECNTQSQRNTRETLVRTLPEFDHNVTAMSIANVGEHMHFMESSACQSFLSRVWRGHLATNTETWRIVMAAALPFVILTMKFRPRTKSHSETDGDEGIYSPLTKGSPVGIGKAVYYYYSSAVVKFLYYVVSMLILFGLFGYFVMVDLQPLWSSETASYAHIRECVIWLWMSTLVAEGFRRIISNQTQSWGSKIADWMKDFWNILDAAVFFLLALSVVLRFVLVGDSFFYARVTYVFCLAIMLIRFTNNLYVHPDLGPKVMMVGRMLNDLLFFIALVVVFIVSYGIASQALLFPNAIPRVKMLKQIFYYPYWAMNGLFDVEMVEGTLSDGKPCSTDRTALENNPELEQCPTSTWIVPLAFCIYVLLVNVLLMNLLIAIFSYTFQQIQDQSNRVWRYTLYSFIEDNHNRPALAPPVIILSHIFRTFKGLYHSCKGTRPTSAFYVRLSDEETARLRAFERYAVNIYNLKKDKAKDETIESHIGSAGERLSILSTKVDQIREDINVVEDLRTEVTTLHKQVEQQTKLLFSILSQLVDERTPTDIYMYEEDGVNPP